MLKPDGGCRMPITVYMAEERSKGGGIIAIAEYSKGKIPVRVLYHGFGHYDALHLPNEQLNSNL
jgi:OTU domain-containing protein 6